MELIEYKNVSIQYEKGNSAVSNVSSTLHLPGI
jgi:hypothetical protein